jgi:hypothetical protein
VPPRRRWCLRLPQHLSPWFLDRVKGPLRRRRCRERRSSPFRCTFHCRRVRPFAAHHLSRGAGVVGSTVACGGGGRCCCACARRRSAAPGARRRWVVASRRRNGRRRRCASSRRRRVVGPRRVVVLRIRAWRRRPAGGGGWSLVVRPPPCALGVSRRARAVGGAAQFCAWRRRLVGAVTASRSRGAAIASVRRVAVLRSRGIVGSSFRRAAVRRVRAVPSPVDGGGGCRSRRDRSSCTAACASGHCRRRRLHLRFAAPSGAGRVRAACCFARAADHAPARVSPTPPALRGWR